MTKAKHLMVKFLAVLLLLSSRVASQDQEALSLSPSLVIAPTSLMGNWKRETERFTPDLKILLLHGPNRELNFDKLADYDIILTTYQLVLRDSDFHQQQHYHYIIFSMINVSKTFPPQRKVLKDIYLSFLY